MKYLKHNVIVCCSLEEKKSDDVMVCPKCLHVQKCAHCDWNTVQRAESTIETGPFPTSTQKAAQATETHCAPFTYSVLQTSEVVTLEALVFLFFF